MLTLQMRCERFAALALLLLLAAVLSGCKPVRESAATQPSKTRSAGSSVAVDSVSYRHDRSMKYTLYDLSQTPPQAIGGEIVGRLAAGGSKGCCLALPAQWRPGLKVRVDWTESDREHSYPEKHSRELEIPRYDRPADLYVVFYPGHDVEVVVSPAEPGHPEWRGRVKDNPWDYCVKNNGRKPCFAALPKMFDTASYKGFCTYLKEERSSEPDADVLCLSATIRCMRDYEDEDFCKSILWGPRRKEQ